MGAERILAAHAGSHPRHICYVSYNITCVCICYVVSGDVSITNRIMPRGGARLRAGPPTRNVNAGGVHVLGAAGLLEGNVNAGGVHASGAGPPKENVNAGEVHAPGAGPPTENVNAGL
eukprot:1356070-Pyramimonas_sp.AAC.1